jgi:hypothetical protein
MVTNEEKVNTILRHIKRVEDNCNLLAKKIMDDDVEFATGLIKLGRLHDVSKFDNFEFTYLGNYETTKPPEFRIALKIHHSKNPHHPEHWTGGIYSMDDIYIAEMVCDCVARGQEFGTDTRKWFEEEATEKYNFSMDDRVGLLIQKYLNLLLSEPFKKG